jgi:putative transposase
MKTTRFTESQIVHALKDYEGGKKAEVVSRDLGITKTTFYNWKKRY